MNNNYYRIVVTAGEEISDCDDRAEGWTPGQVRQWDNTEILCDLVTVDEVLDHFHSTVPLGCMDDFTVVVEEIEPPLPKMTMSELLKAIQTLEVKGPNCMAAGYREELKKLIYINRK